MGRIAGAKQILCKMLWCYSKTKINKLSPKKDHMLNIKSKIVLEI